MSDYLWDKTGEPDDDIAELETTLGSLKYEAAAPHVEVKPRPRRARAVYLVAASITLVAGIGLLRVGGGLVLAPGDEDAQVELPGRYVQTEPETVAAAEDNGQGLQPVSEEWSSLNLELSDPHYYRYAFESGDEALFHSSPDQSEPASGTETGLRERGAEVTGSANNPTPAVDLVVANTLGRHRNSGEERGGGGAEIGRQLNVVQPTVPTDDASVVLGGAVAAVEGRGEEVIRPVNSEEPNRHEDRPSYDANAVGSNAPSAGVPNTERYGSYRESPLVLAETDNLATFSIDVDTGSYTLMRSSIARHTLPVPDAVRAEELINYFEYDYRAPGLNDEVPFSIHLEASPSPFGDGFQLVRLAVQGANVPEDERPPANLVFLIDVSGSMNAPDKLGLVKYALTTLTRSLRDSDTIGIVVYAGSEGVALRPTPVENQADILRVVESLRAGGGTNGEAGIRAAYEQASEAFRPDGINRVIWCTDGDFNVGLTGESLVELIEWQREREIYLTTLGFGRGNYNDREMEQLADRGNGNYAYIDGEREADRVMRDTIGSTIQVIAEDVKIQVAFNHEVVRRYRRIGYDNRVLQDWEFTDDTIDAGEVGAGQNVTAFLEFELQPWAARIADAAELLEARVRYKHPGTASSVETSRSLVVGEIGDEFASASSSYRFATAVAEYAEILRRSMYSEGARFEEVYNIAASAMDPSDPFQREFLELVLEAQRLWDGYERSNAER